MKSTKNISLTLLISLICSTSLHASPKPTKNSNVEKKDPRELFIDADTNGDVKIDFDEFYNYTEIQKRKNQEKQLEVSFTPCDKNQDGNIGLDEVAKEPLTGSKANLNRDTDTCRFPAEAFDLYDLNEDKLISKNEIIETMSRGGRPRKSVRKKQKEMMNKQQSKMIEENFSSCDTDADTFLSLRELVSQKCNRIHMFTEKFDAHDTDHDNYLSLEELQTPQDVKQNFSAAVKANSKMDQFTKLRISLTACDEDDDGMLGKQETITEGCEQDMSYFDSVDHNQDGNIDFNEIERVSLKKQFEGMDKDKNGYLENEEFKNVARRYR